MKLVLVMIILLPGKPFFAVVIGKAQVGGPKPIQRVEHPAGVFAGFAFGSLFEKMLTQGFAVGLGVFAAQFLGGLPKRQGDGGETQISSANPETRFGIFVLADG
ncbi:hypothetical protein [Methylomagnum ishizawai]|uniref:hypothetical protein n=1 Tax=Methylomagnum ishizawai TaxID=1760988 RepID=UPI001C335281|nr:hypothetical protein [Methylomagnum ishizawai]BBL75496.1 hypothetical protein MishRS11D_25940 [Methylomagnum ishizawai]